MFVVENWAGVSLLGTEYTLAKNCWANQIVWTGAYLEMP